MLWFGVGGWLCVLVAACTVSLMGKMGWIDEVMYEVGYVCV